MLRKRVLRAAGCLAAVMLCACATTAASSGPKPALASKLPDFELLSLEGDSVRLSDHLGRGVIVLAFWDTWCEPCKTQLPHLDRIYRAHKDAGLSVWAISMDEPSTAMQVGPYVNESGFAFTVLMDTNGKAASLYNTHKVAPYTVIIGRDGAIASETTGFDPASAKVLEQRIEKLLAANAR